MAISRAIKRLLRVRELEEEQRRLALEAASTELAKLNGALQAAHQRGRRGRLLIAQSAANVQDRHAGVQEIQAAERFAQVLTPRIAEQEKVVAERRTEYMEKRMERRQAETLIEEAKAREELENSRKAQIALDDWYSNKLYREGAQQKSSSARAAEEERPARHVRRHEMEDPEKKSIEQG